MQKYIHLFGGDPKRVTVFGESAGAGSIMHQITAYGGAQGASPFQKAILQSPGFAPLPTNDEQEQLFNMTLAAANVSTVQQLRQLSSAKLQQVNLQIVTNSSYGLFTYGMPRYIARRHLSPSVFTVHLEPLFLRPHIR